VVVEPMKTQHIIAHKLLCYLTQHKCNTIDEITIIYIASIEKGYELQMKPDILLIAPAPTLLKIERLEKLILVKKWP